MACRTAASYCWRNCLASGELPLPLCVAGLGATTCWVALDSGGGNFDLQLHGVVISVFGPIRETVFSCNLRIQCEDLKHIRHLGDGCDKIVQ